MYRAQPVANRLCDQKWKQEQQRLHKKRMQRIKPSIDNKPPPSFNHLRYNRKKVQLEEERIAKITHDNRVLLKKMTEIMQKNQLDNFNTTKPRSLNKERRKRELMRITRENQAILRRIQEREGVYNHYEWEEQRRKNEEYCKNICQYPYRLGDGQSYPYRQEDDFFGDDLGQQAIAEEAERIRRMIQQQRVENTDEMLAGTSGQAGASTQEYPHDMEKAPQRPQDEESAYTEDEDYAGETSFLASASTDKADSPSGGALKEKTGSSNAVTGVSSSSAVSTSSPTNQPKSPAAAGVTTAPSSSSLLSKDESAPAVGSSASLRKEGSGSLAPAVSSASMSKDGGAGDAAQPGGTSSASLNKDGGASPLAGGASSASLSKDGATLPGAASSASLNKDGASAGVLAGTGSSASLNKDGAALSGAASSGSLKKDGAAAAAAAAVPPVVATSSSASLGEKEQASSPAAAAHTTTDGKASGNNTPTSSTPTATAGVAASTNPSAASNPPPPQPTTSSSSAEASQPN